MATEKAPAVTLTVANLQTLEQVEKWADLARALRFPSGSRISVDSLHDALSVTAYLSHTRAPEES